MSERVRILKGFEMATKARTYTDEHVGREGFVRRWIEDDAIVQFSEDDYILIHHDRLEFFDV